MSLVDRVNRGVADLRGRDGTGLSLDDLAETFMFGGNPYPIMQTSMSMIGDEHIASTANDAFKGNGPIYALIQARMQAFSQVRFQWTQFVGSQPGDLFGTPELSVLERPWPGGTTSDLLARMEIHASVAGCAFVTRPKPNRLSVLRPDRVTIILGSQTDADHAAEAPDCEIAGFIHSTSSGDVTAYLPHQVAYYAPIPDPDCRFLGMSWITPVIRELQSDQLMTEHKARFMTNAATPNMAIKFDPTISVEQVKRFKAILETEHRGAWNAYKTLYLGGGADPVVIGKDFRQLDFASTQGKGEPLALDTPVPTPTGWTTMGAVQAGEQVLGRDGRPANVVAVGDVRQGRPCYRITLKNGEQIVADGGHRWAAIDRGSASRRERVYTTDEMREIMARPYSNGAGGHRFSLPASPVVELPELDLLIDPYVLGAWLGDGYTAGAAICGDWEDLKYIAAEIEARGYVTRRWPSSRSVKRAHEADNAAVIGVPAGLLAALSALGTLQDKHIPAEYLRASIQQRTDLLRGLMDTDGSVDHLGRGQCEFSSKDETLARQALELVRSLGYRATLTPKADSRSRTGYQWRVRFRSHPDCVPFTLPRKVERCRDAGEPYFSGRRSIVSIEPVESVPVRCITVDTTDHLFLVGDGFVPTHNSRLAAAAGVPPSWVGFSEGLQGSSLNSGNFQAARRRFSDGTMYHLWTSAATALETLVRPPNSGASLWFDSRVPFMREDADQVAAIQAQQAGTIASLIAAGFIPDTAVKSVMNNDWSLLKHSGLVSVQLLPADGTPAPGQPGDASSNGKAASASMGAGK